MVVMLNNQPLTRLKSLRLDLDENNDNVVYLAFYPSALEINTEAEEIEITEYDKINDYTEDQPKKKKTTKRKTKSKGVSKK